MVPVLGVPSVLAVTSARGRGSLSLHSLAALRA